MTMPSSDVDTDAVRVRALSASWGDMMLCGLWWAWPSSLNGGDGEPELQEAEELLPGLEHLSAIEPCGLCNFIDDRISAARHVSR